MQLAYVKGLAEDLAGEKVQDVIVTVPPFFSQFERDAVADAIEIAGLRTLALINDGTAVAVNYAMTRSFSAPEYHIIYDAGASSIRATVVQFTSDGTGKSAATQIQVVGVGYDRELGGTELDRRLRGILVQEFNGKHQKDIRGDKKGMAKLWKEAGRVKSILSANLEAASTVSKYTMLSGNWLILVARLKAWLSILTSVPKLSARRLRTLAQILRIDLRSRY